MTPRELTDEERQAIHAAYDGVLGAQRVDHLIEDAENYAPFHNPKKYVSYYRCIRGWVRREADKVGTNGQGQAARYPTGNVSRFTGGAGRPQPLSEDDARRKAERLARYE